MSRHRRRLVIVMLTLLTRICLGFYEKRSVGLVFLIARDLVLVDLAGFS